MKGKHLFAALVMVIISLPAISQDEEKKFLYTKWETAPLNESKTFYVEGSQVSMKGGEIKDATVYATQKAYTQVLGKDFVAKVTAVSPDDPKFALKKVKPGQKIKNYGIDNNGDAKYIGLLKVGTTYLAYDDVPYAKIGSNVCFNALKEEPNEDAVFDPDNEEGTETEIEADLTSSQNQKQKQNQGVTVNNGKTTPIIINNIIPGNTNSGGNQNSDLASFEKGAEFGVKYVEKGFNLNKEATTNINTNTNTNTNTDPGAGKQQATPYYQTGFVMETGQIQGGGGRDVDLTVRQKVNGLDVINTLANVTNTGLNVVNTFRGVRMEGVNRRGLLGQRQTNVYNDTRWNTGGGSTVDPYRGFTGSSTPDPLLRTGGGSSVYQNTWPQQ